MRILSLLFVAFTFFLSTSAQATLITVNDGDQFNYDVNDTYQFTGLLSGSNQILTYGVNVDPGEIMSFVVSAPTEFDLLARLSTGPNGSGTPINDPNGNSTIPMGTSFDFPIEGDFFIGLTKWLTIGINTDAIAVIDEIYGGALEVSAITSGDSFYQGGGDTGGGNTSGSVPEPSTLLLMGAALLGFGSIRRKSLNESSLMIA